MSLKNFDKYIVSIFVLSLLLSIFMFWGVTPFLGDATYLDFNIMQNFLHGNGFVLGPNINGDFIPFGKRPPGFSILVGILVYIGFPILVASAIITTLAYSISSIFIYLSLSFFYDKNKSFFATIAFLVYLPFIYYSKIAAPEIVGIMVLSGMLYYYLKFIEDENNESNKFSTIFMFGFIAGTMIWIRYANLIYVAIFFIILFVYTFLLNRKFIKNGFITLAIGTIVTLSMMIRNYISTGDLSGHPANNKMTNEFSVAVVKSFNYLTNNIFKLDNNSQAIAIVIILFLSLIALFIICTNYKNQKKLFMVLPIALMPIGYLLFFCYVQSTTRVDDVSDRYLLPFYLSILWQIIYIAYYIQGRLDKYKLYTNVLLFGLLAMFTYINLSKASVVRKYDDRDYSPKTLEYMIKNTPKDSVIIGNRYLSQIFMYTLDYRVIAFPFYSQYNKDYGRKLAWTKKDFLELIVQKDISTIVFFTGPDKKENFFKRNDYGDFIKELLNGNSNLLLETIVLEDGFYMKLQSKGFLLNELSKINKDDIILNNQEIKNIKFDKYQSEVKITDMGVSISEKNIEKSSLTSILFENEEVIHGIKISFKLPLQKIKMLSFTLRTDNGYAHFFFDKNSLKFNEVELIPETISREKSFSFDDAVKTLSIRIYPLTENEINEFVINKIIIYTKE